MPRTIAILILLSIWNWALSQTDSSYVELLNIRYLPANETGVDSLQSLNLVLPDDVSHGPILIWIGGGAWSFVNRHVEMDLARKLAHASIAVATIGHRLSSAVWRDPERNTGVVHPTHAEDVAAAVKWIVDNASKYRYDTEQIYIGGFSSGAHLASLIALDPSYLQKHNLDLDIFKGVIPISGAYDIENYYEVFLNGNNPNLAKEHVQAVFGESREEMRKYSPTSYLQNLKAPMLIITDAGLTNYTRIFENGLKDAGFKNYEVHYETELGHGALWRHLSFDEESKYRQMMIDFIHKRL